MTGEFFDNLTDMLIEGDIGAKTAFEICELLEKRCRKDKIQDEKAILQILKELIMPHIKTVTLSPEPGKVSVYLVLGVNGVGKTTSVAKLAKYYTDKGVYTIMAAADTFRAAAIEQLMLHGDKIGVRVVSHQHGSDPSSVVFDAAAAVSAKGDGLVLADTAGRLHNKENLVRELQKIDRIAREKASGGAYKKILVLDATTGQNALRQAEVFNESVGVDAVVLTKYDSTAKGGIVITLGKELNIPVAYICTGENYGDIEDFNPETYISDFLGL
ncbi:MAG TPA: signal recognition particle-docking protein FtsY [Treponemataceae bacterium]|nr:signal recognition particle-docking protein FtsY [Treponemataceae bacterium]